MREQLTTADVMAAVKAAGIKHPAELMPYVGGQDNPHRTKVMAAVRAGDPLALGIACAEAIDSRLRSVGLTERVDVHVLRALSSADGGWPLVHDVACERENTARILNQRIQRFRQAAANSTRQAAENRQPPPPPSDAPAQSAEPPQFRQQAPEQARRPDRAPAQQQRPAYQQPPPPRRHDAGTVRHIGEARMAREAAQDNASVEASFDQVKVHGGKAALTLEASTTRNKDLPTINIEAARMLDAQARTYDWDNKIIVQLTPSELQQVTALLYGMIDHVKFQNHGRANDKWFEIQRQSGQYAGTTKFAVGQGDQMCLVQLTPADLGNVLALFIRQCARQMKIEQAALYSALRPVATAITEHRNARGGGGAGPRRHAG